MCALVTKPMPVPAAFVYVARPAFPGAVNRALVLLVADVWNAYRKLADAANGLLQPPKCEPAEPEPNTCHFVPSHGLPSQLLAPLLGPAGFEPPVWCPGWP